jgi:hypothetical protein
LRLHQEDTLRVKAANTSETWVSFYLSTWGDNPEDGHLHFHRHEDLKSHLSQMLHNEINYKIILSIIQHDFILDLTDIRISQDL